MNMTLVALLLALTAACGGHNAHRAEVEDALGHPVADWPGYFAHAEWFCGLKPAAFAAELDKLKYKAYHAAQADVRHICPRRLQEIANWEAGNGPVLP